MENQYARERQSDDYNRQHLDSFGFEDEIVHVWDPVKITAGLIVLFLAVFLLSRFTFSSSDELATTSIRLSDRSAYLENIVGKVKISPVEGEDYWVSEPSSVLSGHVIKTSHASSGALRVNDDTSLHLRSNTEIRIKLNGEKLLLDVFTGNVLVQLNPNAKSKPVELPFGSIRVLSNEGVFEIQRNSGHSVALSVSEGTLEIEGPELTESIEAGKNVVLNTKDIRLTTTPTAMTESSSAKPKKPKPVNLVSAIAKIFPKNARTKKVSVPTKVKRPNLSEERIRSFQKTVTPKTLNPRRDEAQRPLQLPAYELVKSEKSTDLVQYEEAAQESQANIAILRYDSVAESDSRYAELAAHRAAQLVAQTKDTEETARRYQIIQQRFPSGQLAKPALKELVDTRLKREELHEARGALNRFIAENPTERKSKDLAFLSGEIFRREKRYKDAIREYQRSMGSQYDEDAMYYSAWAMLQVDPNSDHAYRRLSAYRTQFPDGRYRKEVNAVLNARRMNTP